MHYKTLLIWFSRDGIYRTVGGQADIGFKVCTMVYTAHMCAYKLGPGARTSTWILTWPHELQTGPSLDFLVFWLEIKFYFQFLWLLAHFSSCWGGLYLGQSLHSFMLFFFLPLFHCWFFFFCVAHHHHFFQVFLTDMKKLIYYMTFTPNFKSNYIHQFNTVQNIDYHINKFDI